MDDQVVDAVDELTYMISGDARAKLQKIGYDSTASLPILVRGETHTVKYISRDGPTILNPFEAENGNFYVEASFT